MNWNLVKAIGASLNYAASKVPLARSPKTVRVPFRKVPVGDVFLKPGTGGDRYRRVSHDEATPLEPDYL